MKDSIPELITDNLIITVLSPDDSSLLATYENNNRVHLSRWEPKRADNYFTEESVKNRVALSLKSFHSGSSIPLVGLDTSRSRVICTGHFSNIVHGVFQACNLGYSVNVQDQGKGLMFEMLQESIEYAFITADLHRIMANYMPSNIRSGQLLTRLGFEKEGVAKSYLKIAGSWQDHILTSKINPSHASK
ncbi:MAG: GNAT family N-acetyltransferase [Psychromonas sp.]